MCYVERVQLQLVLLAAVLTTRRKSMSMGSQLCSCCRCLQLAYWGRHGGFGSLQCASSPVSNLLQDSRCVVFLFQGLVWLVLLLATGIHRGGIGEPAVCSVTSQQFAAGRGVYCSCLKAVCTWSLCLQLAYVGAALRLGQAAVCFKS
jgi:hypothetical protein